MWSPLKAWQAATRNLSSASFQNLMGGTAWAPSISSVPLHLLNFRGAILGKQGQIRLGSSRAALFVCQTTPGQQVPLH